MTEPNPLACPHCHVQLFRASKDGSRVKARTSILVMHKSGEVEINCPSCSGGVIVPLQPAPHVELKKAAMSKPRFVVRRKRQNLTG